MPLVLFMIACTTNVYQSYYSVTDVPTDTTETVAPSDTPSDTGWVEIDPPVEVNVSTEELAFDPFMDDGNVYWFDVSEETLLAMNTAYMNGDWYYGPLYTVDDEGEADVAAEHLYVMDVTQACADYERVQTNIVGQSSGTTWTTTTIPNLSLDSNEYVSEQYFDYVNLIDHVRLNNAQVGSMYGEPSALAIYAALGYPVPKTAYAFVGGTPWQNAEVLVPEIAVEVYKPAFCDEHAKELGGGCVNIWEGQGTDISTWSVAQFDNGCEISTGCDSTHLAEFATVVEASLYQPGFEEATEAYFDWELFHTFQCVEWYIEAGDDYINNLNNVVLFEGDDDRFRLMPYSLDISAGLAWGGAWMDMPLFGWANMSMGCQYDPECYEHTIARCSEVIDAVEALDVANTILVDLHDRLAATRAPWGDDGGNGMLRSPDDSAYETATDFYQNRPAAAREELAALVPPYSTGCDTGTLCDTGF